MRFFYVLGILSALPLSELKPDFDKIALSKLYKRAGLEDVLAEKKANREAAKAAKKAGKISKEQKELIKAQKQRDLDSALEAKKEALEPAKVQPSNLAKEAVVGKKPGEVDSISVRYTKNFVEKHVHGLEGAGGTGDEKTVIKGTVAAFGEGRITPNRRGPGDRLILPTQASVEVEVFVKTPSGKNFATKGTARKRLVFSGRPAADGLPAVIDHLEQVLSSATPVQPKMEESGSSSSSRSIAPLRGSMVVSAVGPEIESPFAAAASSRFPSSNGHVIVSPDRGQGRMSPRLIRFESHSSPIAPLPLRGHGYPSPNRVPGMASVSPIRLPGSGMPRLPHLGRY